MLIPVGYKKSISFEGINLDLYQVCRDSPISHARLLSKPAGWVINPLRVTQGRVFTIGTELMKNVEEEVNFEGGPFYIFSGFNVSLLLA